MKFVSLFQIQLISVGIACTSQVSGFSPRFVQWRQPSITSKIVVLSHPNADRVMEKSSAPEDYSFIDTELRGAAMRLHTRSQAPKEGKATEKPKPREPYVTTRDDYLKFLVDSQHVYKAFEETPIGLPALAPFYDTNLERVAPLEKDIEFMVQEYGLTRPSVGKYGEDYAQVIRDIAAKGEDHVPEYICHYYNHYFAHTAGGRMIGKQMSAQLLDKKTLEFYKWDGDLNKIKATVKNDIEKLAATWTQEQKDQCVEATAAAFMGGGSINSYLAGRANPH